MIGDENMHSSRVMCTTTLKKMEMEDWADKGKAAVGEGGGDQNQVPKEAFFLNKPSCKKKEPGMVQA